MHLAAHALTLVPPTRNASHCTGKGAYPNYIIDGVIHGFPEMGDHKMGLRNLTGAAQFRGVWTWTRGGGWWGPYIHGHEFWVDLHAQVLARWYGKPAPTR